MNSKSISGFRHLAPSSPVERQLFDFNPRPQVTNDITPVKQQKSSFDVFDDDVVRIMPRPKRNLKFDEALNRAQIENTNP